MPSRLLVAEDPDQAEKPVITLSDRQRKLIIARDWVRWTFGVLVAVAISYALITSIEHHDVVAACKRNGDFKNTVATVIVSPGAKRAMRSTIPLATEKRHDDRPYSEKEISDGCNAAFPPPLPFLDTN